MVNEPLNPALAIVQNGIMKGAALQQAMRRTVISLSHSVVKPPCRRRRIDEL